jgi:hypothetical protein
MHAAREGKSTKINERTIIVEWDDKVVLSVGIDQTVLNELEVATLRNLLSAWKNTKRYRERRRASSVK